ncbi:hypothetical protein NYR55_10580 [Sphingomonas sp. BGYR3]|uniref:hypothetical protein n=1 Tax=Sphingomonas sp. BGYR3 TaxID=2975483 RepID=UPI0021A5BE97|nr:hypothetical protein [Sphingomonas sp. BGYR3]MDG5489057.1 hypothetical protein [Sphingomonas sp. BGYR3]
MATLNKTLALAAALIGIGYSLLLGPFIASAMPTTILGTPSPRKARSRRVIIFVAVPIFRVAFIINGLIACRPSLQSRLEIMPGHIIEAALCSKCTNA